MTVYVDAMRPTPKPFRPHRWRYNRACHMLADTNVELEAMARKLQLRQTWRHGEHYDLTANKRAQAVAAGAREVDTRTIATVMKNQRIGKAR